MAKNMFIGRFGPRRRRPAPWFAARPGSPRRHPHPARRHDDRCRGVPLPALARRPRPARLFHQGATPGGDPQGLIGTVVRNEISAGQPMTQGVAGPARASAASSPRRLGPGMRAVTVGVSATSGVAGFVFPGDRVDLVLTQEVTGGGDGPPLKRLRDHRPQHPRARHRPAHQLARRGRASRGRPYLRHRHASRRPPRSPRRSRSRRRSASSRCRCARSPTTMPSWSARSRPARCRCRTMPIRMPSGRCCSPSPASRSTPTRPTRSVPTCPGSSASTVPARHHSNDGNNNGPRPAPVAAQAMQPVGPVVRVARGNNVTLVPVGAR